MALKNTQESYGLIAKILHWIIALMVVSLLGVGLYMHGLDPSPAKFHLYAWHKSFGVCVLILMTLRFLWKFISPTPNPLPEHQQWEKILAKIVHVFFYLALLCIPLTGWIMSSAKGFSVSVFGLFTLPDFVKENQKLAETAANLHEFLAFAVIGGLILHVGGALKHHVIDKDSTLRRMLPVLVIFTLLPGSVFSQETAPAWIIGPEHSRLSFTGTQMGAEFEGEFKEFDGEIFFDPENLEKSSAKITVDVASATTNNPDRDQYITQKDWFFVEAFPHAVFQAKSFEKTDENTYIAHGDLTIRGITLPIELPFTLTIEEKTADMRGELALKRLDYGVGQGDWKDTQSVGNDVIVRIQILAQKSTSPSAAAP